MRAALAAAPQFRPIAVERSADISEHVCPMRYETAIAPAPSSPQLLGYRLGPVSLVRYESCGVEHGVRSVEHIRNNPLDCFILCLPLQARFQFSHAGLRSDIVQGAAVLLSAQRPFDAYVSGSASDARHTSMQVRIPGPLLRGRVQRVDLLCNHAMPVSSGAGRIMLTALQSTVQDAGELNEAQAQRHGQALADLIANCIDQIEIGASPSRSEASPGASVFDRATAFVECRLSDPALDARQIADHCHVSTSYLHKLFARRALTVAGYVREMRLQRCRDALRDTGLAQRSVIEIASHWGFSDPSHFGRVYRKRFGLAPSLER